MYDFRLKINGWDRDSAGCGASHPLLTAKDGPPARGTSRLSPHFLSAVRDVGHLPPK